MEEETDMVNEIIRIIQSLESESEEFDEERVYEELKRSLASA